MGIAGINSSYGSISINKSSHDSYENNIKKQINALEEKMKTISNDEEKPAEQKAKEKQAAQEQLQNLNQELKEYQIQKRQEEAQKKQEEAKEAAREAFEAANETQKEPVAVGFNHKEAGVMISLSTTQTQLAGMVRLRTSLEGKQRTADTEEEKADLQKRINNLSGGIGRKTAAAKNTISNYQKTAGKDDNKDPKKPKTDSRKEEVFWTDAKTSAKNKTAAADKPFLSNKNKLFDTVSYMIK